MDNAVSAPSGDSLLLPLVVVGLGAADLFLKLLRLFLQLLLF
jgi:hypothetical protein